MFIARIAQGHTGVGDKQGYLSVKLSVSLPLSAIVETLMHSPEKHALSSVDEANKYIQSFLSSVDSVKAGDNKACKSLLSYYMRVMTNVGILPKSYTTDVILGFASEMHIEKPRLMRADTYDGKDFEHDSSLLSFVVSLNYSYFLGREYFLSMVGGTSALIAGKDTQEFGLFLVRHYGEYKWTITSGNEGIIPDAEPMKRCYKDEYKLKSYHSGDISADGVLEYDDDNAETLKRRVETLKSLVKGSMRSTHQTGGNVLWSECERTNLVPRDELINQMLQVLIRKKKPNICLTGEYGVGRTTVVKMLADRILSGDVPEQLKNGFILELNPCRIVAGCRYRGDLEERIANIVREVTDCDAKPCILFIDDMGNIPRMGDSDSGTNMANLLAPYLQSGAIQIIGCCTETEYTHVLDCTPMFRDVVTKLPVYECTDKEVIYQVVRNNFENLKTFYKLKQLEDGVADKLVRDTIFYTNKYMPNKMQPDKSVTVLDSAIARAVVMHSDVNAEQVRCVISEMTGIPVEHMSMEERERLRGLAMRIKQVIKGQDDAVDSVCSSIIANKVGLHDNKKPIGNYLFAGSTGVGKTELCKVLAKELFGSPKAMVRVDMSEFMEAHSVSKLIGAPKGYVGYGTGGFLTDAVESKPYCVLLFDEIEKAHPDVLNLLLQIMDDGRLTDSAGKTVDFSNCLIIMTSNLGAKRKGEGRSCGFTVTDVETQRREMFMDAIKAVMKPEFVGRISEIIVFNTLSKMNIKDITRRMLDELVEQVKEQGVELTYTDALVDYCIEKGYNEDSGARPMRNFIQKEVRTFIANALVEGAIADNTLRLSYTEKRGIYSAYTGKKALAGV